MGCALSGAIVYEIDWQESVLNHQQYRLNTLPVIALQALANLLLPLVLVHSKFSPPNFTCNHKNISHDVSRNI